MEPVIERLGHAIESQNEVYPPDHLHRIRTAEMEVVRANVSLGRRVLEIGGSDGFQAAILARAGSLVTSIDVTPTAERGEGYFPVQVYDGTHIPAEDGAFDMIFSSNVLEHVKDLPALCREMHRVLRPEGILVHVLPSSSWRFWTSLAHYGHLARLALGRQPDFPVRGKLGETVRRRGLLGSVARAVLAGPHGEHRTAFSELFCFSAPAWRRFFVTHGFVDVRRMPSRLFYTGYGLLPGMSVALRRGLSRFLGSSTHVFVMRSGKLS